MYRSRKPAVQNEDVNQDCLPPMTKFISLHSKVFSWGVEMFIVVTWQAVDQSMLCILLWLTISCSSCSVVLSTLFFCYFSKPQRNYILECGTFKVHCITLQPTSDHHLVVGVMDATWCTSTELHLHTDIVCHLHVQDKLRIDRTHMLHL